MQASVLKRTNLPIVMGNGAAKQTRIAIITILVWTVNAANIPLTKNVLPENLEKDARTTQAVGINKCEN